MDVLVTASLIGAFLAGIAALFAPCCISVLLPTYFASIFKAKTKIFFMTFVYFAGLSLVFLPLGLGFGGLGAIFREAHNLIYYLGALFLIVLAATVFLGFHFSLPFSFNQKLESQNIPSVLVLGVFSGLATTCCAPVLAGVLTLSALPGSVLWGGIYSLAYVLGMVAPLFVIAWFMDKSDLTQKFLFFKKGLAYRIGKRQVSITYANLISASTFLALGILILVLNMTGKLQTESSLQAKTNVFLMKLVDSISVIIGNVPGFVPALFFLVMLLVIVGIVLKGLSNRSR